MSVRYKYVTSWCQSWCPPLWSPSSWLWRDWPSHTKHGEKRLSLNIHLAETTSLSRSIKANLPLPTSSTTLQWRVACVPGLEDIVFLQTGLTDGGGGRGVGVHAPTYFCNLPLPLCCVAGSELTSSTSIVMWHMSALAWAASSCRSRPGNIDYICSFAIFLILLGWEQQCMYYLPKLMIKNDKKPILKSFS